MNKRERIEAAVAGERADTVPYSLWTHLPGIDLDPVRNAEHTFQFYQDYDVDILKTMNNGMYSVEDFGARVDYSQIEAGGVAVITDSPVKKAEDWESLEPASTEKGALLREQTYLKLLLEKTGKEVPVLFTVFSPLTTAFKLCPDLMKHVSEGHGNSVKHALRVIAETTCRLTERVIGMGADGIFLLHSCRHIAGQRKSSTGNTGNPMIWKCCMPPGVVQYASCARKRHHVSPAERLSGGDFQLACMGVAAGGG